MSDENVGGLVAKWRAETDINAPRLLHPEACEAKRECADELEATLSAHGGLLFTQGDMERFAGYVADAREERLKSAHGQPVVDDGSKTCAEILLATELSGDFPYAAEAIMQGKWEYIDSRAAIRAISAALTGAAT